MTKYTPPNKPNITQEERQQFRQAMQNPFQYAATTPPEMNQVEEDQPVTSNFSGSDYLAYLDDSQWVNEEDKLFFTRQGLQNKLLKKFKRGELTVQAKLDLHGKKADEAIQHMKAFLQNCQALQRRHALIIHGKGKFNRSHKPILKNLLNQWLPTRHEVLAFSSAQTRHGGTGAVYVLIKLGE